MAGKGLTASEVSGRIYGMADGVVSARREAIFQTALAAKAIHVSHIRRAGVETLSGMGGAKIGARFDVKGFKNPTALVKATGPAHIVNNPTVGHGIASRRFGGSRKRRGQRALSRQLGRFIPGAGIRTPFGPKAWVSHPGTRGKGFWQKGQREVARKTPELYMKSHNRAVFASFYGGSAAGRGGLGAIGI